MTDERPNARMDDRVRARLRELYPSCVTDCRNGCKYGCLGWLHRFGVQRGSLPAERERPERSSHGDASA